MEFGVLVEKDDNFSAGAGDVSVVAGRVTNVGVGHDQIELAILGRPISKPFGCPVMRRVVENQQLEFSQRLLSE